ncbi:MAG: hypothetical protein SAK29_33915, partial [Scytonema sp. PMC 1069.18]|nr:hypothetical protein [Scytonema sp. PMC 1069.18]
LYLHPMPKMTQIVFGKFLVLYSSILHYTRASMEFWINKEYHWKPEREKSLDPRALVHYS